MFQMDFISKNFNFNKYEISTDKNFFKIYEVAVVLQRQMQEAWLICLPLIRQKDIFPLLKQR